MVPPPTAETLLSHTGFVRHLALRLLRDTHEAEDVVQQVFLAALRRPPEPSRPLRPWLTRVAHNLAIDMHRARGRRNQSERAAAHDDVQPSTGHVVALDSAQRDLVGTVVDLPEPYRTAIFLHFYEELPPRTIARRLGVPVETVRTRIKRGVAMLRGKLHGEDRDRAKYWAVALTELARPALEARPPFWKRALPIAAAASIGALCAWLWTTETLLSTAEAAPVAQVETLAPEPSAPAHGVPATPTPDRAEQAPLPPDEEASLFRVRVITDEGEMIVPDARIDIFSGGTKVAEARTDENGEIELRHQPGSDIEIRIGMTRVSLAYSTELDVERRRDTSEPTVVRVPAASSVSGHVVDEQGFAVPFARVVAWTGFASTDEQWRFVSPGHRVIADRNGKFTMLGLRHRFRLEAFWNHLVARETFKVDVDRAQHLENVELRVYEPKLVHGRVVDELGLAVDGADVRIVSNDADRPGPEPGTVFTPPDTDRTKTQPDGTFVIRGMPSAPPTIVVVDDDHAPRVIPPPDPGDVSDETVDIALEAGSSLDLWVTNANGKGISTASALFFDLAGTVRRVAANDLGYMRFEHLPSDTAGFLRVEASGYAPDIREIKKIGKKKSSLLDIELPPPRVVRGRVLGVGRIPIRGAIVRAHLAEAMSGSSDPAWLTARANAVNLGEYLTPADGKFKFPSTPWRRFVLDVTTPQGHRGRFDVDYNQVAIECTFDEGGPGEGGDAK